MTVFHRDHVTVVDGSTVELSDEAKRTLVVLPASEAKQGKDLPADDHDTIQVVWRFHEAAGTEKCTHCKHSLGG